MGNEQWAMKQEKIAMEKRKKINSVENVILHECIRRISFKSNWHIVRSKHYERNEYSMEDNTKRRYINANNKPGRIKPKKIQIRQMLQRHTNRRTIKMPNR